MFLVDAVIHQVRLRGSRISWSRAGPLPYRATRRALRTIPRRIYAASDKLHLDGRSSVWKDRPEAERELNAAVATMDIYQVQYLRLIHQLESWLARYWPEVTRLVELSSATLLAVLARVGGPGDVSASSTAVRKLMTGMSHRLMTAEKIEQVLDSASNSVGLPLLPAERVALMAIAAEALDFPPLSGQVDYAAS